jgi:hypothetical protein
MEQNCVNCYSLEPTHQHEMATAMSNSIPLSVSSEYIPLSSDDEADSDSDFSHLSAPHDLVGISAVYRDGHASKTDKSKNETHGRSEKGFSSASTLDDAVS